MHSSNLPAWDDIPEVPGMPKGCAWGLFDRDGQRDQVGTLNLLTPEKILEAKEEIQHGESVCLNWFLHHVPDPAAERKPFEHKIKSLRHLGYAAYDDEISINTQTSSQWDGLIEPSASASIVSYITDSIRIRREDWSLRGGIVGRGVLIDYHQWAKDRQFPHPPVERTCITIAEIEEVARAQGLELRPADILIIRTGWTDWYNGASDTERTAGTTGDKHIGLVGNEETIKWLWNHHFAAVASDSLAFEAWPTKPPYGMEPQLPNYQLCYVQD
ncbi:cyclase [Trichoderma arundinaceum]|uniref:Cyclase n=1 Tax=Trichoderma arundinaceum TaxID=490622 RepID=A0A395NDC5_TRIAR|nr:cyclase [Trichoderma arundinaceum]